MIWFFKGKFIWPGFSENMRVLRWVVERSRGRGFAVESPIGWVPRFKDLDFTGSPVTEETFIQLMVRTQKTISFSLTLVPLTPHQTIDRDAWYREIQSHNDHFWNLYDRLPKEMIFTRELILSALWRSPKSWGLNPERSE